MGCVLTRRGFLGGTVALAGARLLGVPVAEPRLRLGVLSDPHVIDRNDELLKAFRYFDGRCADGIVLAGDLADFGLIPQLELVGAAWDSVFPGNRRSDGAPIEKLFVYGDHDMGGYMHKRDYVIRRYPDAEALEKLVIPNNDPKAVWERVFHEEWSVIRRKTVRGYDFILGSFTRPKDPSGWQENCPTEGITECMAKWQNRKSPFFFVQHRPLSGTFPYYSKFDRPNAATRALEPFRNCIAITGHTHHDLHDKDVVWRGRGCLCLDASSLSRAGGGGKFRLADGKEKKRHNKFGWLIEVFDGRIELEKLDFASSPRPLCPRTALDLMHA